ncbi:MAG: gliding motility-associated-like protein [Flavobacteriaceae bacterium]
MDASSTLCSQVISSIATVIVNGNPTVFAGDDLELCEPNGSIATEVILNGSGATTYTWDNGVIDGVSFVPPGAQITVYTVTGTDANGCIGTDQVTVSSYPLPVAIGTATPIYGNAPLVVDFTNLSSNATAFTWDFGDLNTANTTGLSGVSNEYLSAGIYVVTLVASNEICSDAWQIEIEVIPPMIVTPPNVFSPNEDGSNDLYFVNVDYGEQFEALILNRWGNVMATLDSVNQGWNGSSPNGTQAEEGVYFVVYTATDFNGNQISGHSNFTLVR